MGRQKLTAEKVEYIKKHYMTQTSSVMGNAIGLCSSTVRRRMRQEGWKTPMEVTKEATASATRGKSICTPEQDQVIKLKYLTTPVCTLARELDISTTCLTNRYRQLNLVVPKEIKQSFKVRFKPGHTPHCKGRKQTEWMSKESIENSKASRFKKGDLPHNAYEKDGAISIRKYKSGVCYKFIRISLAEWEPLHLNTWRKLYGEIPENHLVIFKDGNNLNCDPKNLLLISRKKYALKYGPAATLEDSAIAVWLATKGRVFDRELFEELLDNHPELIELKRNQLLLNRELNKI